METMILAEVKQGSILQGALNAKWNSRFIFLTGVCVLISIFALTGCGEDTMEQSNSSPPVRNVASVSDVSERMQLFSREEGHQVTALIENLKAAEVNLQGNINEYKKTLSGLGRYLNNTTIHEWELLARDVGVDRQKLEENLKQAFLWSEKFRLAPSAGHKAELAARVSEGNELVSEISSRYHELMKIKTTS